MANIFEIIRSLPHGHVAAVLGTIKKSDECYEALDWLVSKQEEIEKELAEKYLTEGSLILYDLTSTGLLRS